MGDFYPVMLDVRERPVVVIGGDAVAAEKAGALLACGARVTAISPTFGAAWEALLASDHLTLLCRAYETGDARGAFLIVSSATREPALAERIWRDAERQGTLVNIVDVPARCSFIVPSILRRGPLTIAVSTGGTNPSLAKRIRQRLEAFFPPVYGAYLRVASVARGRLRAGGVPYDRRDAFFGEFFASGALERLERDDLAGALATTAALLDAYGVAAEPAALAGELARLDGAERAQETARAMTKEAAHGA